MFCLKSQNLLRTLTEDLLYFWFLQVDVPHEFSEILLDPSCWIFLAFVVHWAIHSTNIYWMLPLCASHAWSKVLGIQWTKTGKVSNFLDLSLRSEKAVNEWKNFQIIISTTKKMKQGVIMTGRKGRLITITHSLTMGIRSEKCFIRWFCCVNIVEYAHTDLGVV